MNYIELLRLISISDLPYILRLPACQLSITKVLDIFSSPAKIALLLERHVMPKSLPCADFAVAVSSQRDDRTVQRVISIRASPGSN
jgi:hypothetical protein